MTETLNTSKQVQIQYSSSGVAAAATTGNGNIIFDAANHSIWANGIQWLMTDTHLTNYFKTFVNGSESSTFIQSSPASINLTSTDGVIEFTNSTTSGNASITIKHTADSSDGMSHIPTGGSSGKYLAWQGGSDSANAKWSDTSYGRYEKPTSDASIFYPIYILNGVPTSLGYYMQKSVPSDAKLTDTLSTISVNSAINPTITLQSSTSTTQQISGGTDVSVVGTGTQIQISAGTNLKVPTDGDSGEDTSVALFYNWYSNYAITGNDEDGIIENWQEILDFLSESTESQTLSGLLANKSNKEHLSEHAIVSKDVSGMVPQIVHNTTNVNSGTNDWVLTSTKGGTPTWRKLPTATFNDASYNATYTVSGPLSGTDATVVTANVYNLGSNKVTNYVSSSTPTATTYVDASNNGTITLHGPSLITELATSGTPTVGTTYTYDSSIAQQTMFWYEITA